MMQPLASAWVKPPLMQILVVVANIQMRALKTEAGKGSKLDISQSVLRDKVTPFEKRAVLAVCTDL